MSKLLYVTTCKSDIGDIHLAANDNELCMLEFDNQKRIDHHLTQILNNNEYVLEKTSNSIIEQTIKQLNEYFNKQRNTFTIPLAFHGTDFQKRVWNELLNINFGTTRTYKEQAIAVGDLKAIRAVATANGQNRISIIVPCHRVIGSNGDLTGYGGELWRKKHLLELESNQQSLF